jgi:EpsI family protein
MNHRFRSMFSWPLVGTFVLLAATLGASKLTAHRKSEILVKPLDTIDRHIAGFTGTDNPPLTDHVLSRLLSDSYLTRTYHKPGIQADLFIAFYAQQRAGESMHSPKHCLPGAGWEIWDYGSAEIPVNGSSFKVNRYSISHEGQRMLVLYWYQSKGRIIASEYVGKILLARDALLQNSTSASIVRIMVPDKPGALEDARAFASELIPQVQRCFGSR